MANSLKEHEPGSKRRKNKANNEGEWMPTAVKSVNCVHALGVAWQSCDFQDCAFYYQL